jgi:flagellar biosynthetic protein FliO
MFLAQSSAAAELGLLALETVAVLALIAVAAWAFVRFVAPRLRGARGKARLRVLERLPLEPRRALYVVEVDGRPLLIGVAEGAVTLLKELEPRAPAEVTR